MSIIRVFFNLLPDLAGILLAALSVALLFVPKQTERVTRHSRLSTGLAVLLIMIGIGGLISSKVQKDNDKLTASRERRELQEKLDTQNAALIAAQRELSDKERQILQQGNTVLEQSQVISSLSERILNTATGAHSFAYASIQPTANPQIFEALLLTQGTYPLSSVQVTNCRY